MKRKIDKIPLLNQSLEEVTLEGWKSQRSAHCAAALHLKTVELMKVRDAGGKYYYYY